MDHISSGDSINFDGSSSYYTAGTIVGYEWDFDYDYENFDVESSETATTEPFDTAGEYVVALRVITDDDPAKYDIDTITITVGDVKLITEANDTTWYDTITNALSAASDGNEIVVYPGTFEESITIDKDITLRSLYNTDWENVKETIIESSSDSNAVTVSTGTECQISGFTIKDGLRGIYCTDSNSLTLSNLIITGNDANTVDGGGIYFERVDADIDNCYIIENEAANGGGIYCEDSDLELINCVFWENTAKAVSSCGGGLYFVDSDISIDRNTFSKNSSVEYGGAICSDYDSNTVSVYNSIFWNNTANTTDYDIYNAGTSSISLNRCIISDYATGSNLLSSSPNFRDEDDIFGADSIAGTCDDGLRPLPETAAIDAAYKTTSTPTTDIAGNSSIDSFCTDTGTGTPDYIDIGAYEVPRIFFVDCNVTGGDNDGNTWDDAYNYLRDALDDNRLTAGDWIFVSEGTYCPDANATDPNGDNDPDKRFDLVDGVYVFGGFTESAGLHSRNWSSGVYSANLTILDGDLGDANSKTVVIGGDNARLDGFKVRNGINTSRPGGGLKILTDDMVVANCVFKDNYSSYSGGAVYTTSYQYEETVIFENCVFSDNRAGMSSTGYGGAVYNDGVKAVFSNCVFSGNGAADGGAICNVDSLVEISNCTFSDNIGTDDANSISDVIYNINNSDVTAYNTVIWNNTEDGCGELVYNETGCETGFSYCVIKDCGDGNDWNSNYGQDLGNNTDSDPRFANVENPLGIDLLFGTIDDGLKIKAESSCIDAADYSKAPALDIAGKIRLDVNDVNNTGTGTIDYLDIGAYEYRGDSDGDGMPDEWEEFYGLNPNDDDAYSDLDDDSHKNLSEYLHGSDPNDVNDIPTDNTTIFVPKDVSSINDAIDLAINGDTIKVDTGTYVENVNFDGKSLSLVSFDPEDPSVVAATIIDPDNTSRTIDIKNGNGANVVIEGFTVEGGSYGIDVYGYCAKIKNCIIQNCTTRGIQLSNCLNSSIISCTAKDTIGQHGIFIEYSTVVIDDCNSSNNDDCGISAYYSNVTVSNSLISLNNKEPGIYNYKGVLSVDNCLICNNESSGVYCVEGDTEIINSTIDYNYNGISTSSVGAYPIKVLNTVISNQTSKGIYFYNSHEKDISNCIITKNSIGIKSRIDPTQNGKIGTVRNSIIWGNDSNFVDIEDADITYCCIGNNDGTYEGLGNFNIDPLFQYPDSNDYHLDSNSLCIDAGEPWADYSNEPSPNGGRINIGLYGNTSEATTTTDADNDGICDNWEKYYWPNDDPNQHDPNDNDDGDRFTNESEYLYGYDPNAETDELIKVLHMEFEPSPFDPTSPPYETVIKYWSNASCSSILDCNQIDVNEIVRSLPDDTVMGYNEVSWDGRDSNGLIAYDGSYIVQVRIPDPNSADFSGETIQLYYDHDINDIITCNPNRILPLNNEITTISFDMSPKRDVVVSVYDPNENIFWTSLVNSTDPNEIIWDGKSTDGTSYVPVYGEYTIKVRYDGMRENNQRQINVCK
ncbi:MAG: right-handed parallel beta-helix repeat-containing protein [Planctomycetes bacterium]|nr:right-handed parallel beta-helix repeat-containing protein [Planctomycetota bacterium]